MEHKQLNTVNWNISFSLVCFWCLLSMWISVCLLPVRSLWWQRWSVWWHHSEAFRIWRSFSMDLKEESFLCFTAGTPNTLVSLPFHCDSPEQCQQTHLWCFDVYEQWSAVWCFFLCQRTRVVSCWTPSDRSWTWSSWSCTNSPTLRPLTSAWSTCPAGCTSPSSPPRPDWFWRLCCWRRDTASSDVICPPESCDQYQGHPRGSSC